MTKDSFIWVFRFVLPLFIFFSCKKSNTDQRPLGHLKKVEAHEDSLELVKAYKNQSKILDSVHAKVETEVIQAKSEEDAADDPAIWVNKTAPSKSVIYGSNKKGGLAAYNLAGEEIAFYPIGKINNVDILYDYPLGKETTTILGCTNRTTQSIDLFVLDPTSGNLTPIKGRNLKVNPKEIDDIYGFCFARDAKSPTSYLLINGKNGLMQQYALKSKEDSILLDLVRSVQFDSQTEGMVADPLLGNLYVGEEAKGIWKLSINPKDTMKNLLVLSDERNPNIKYDIEGLSALRTNNAGYLVASSQGNFSYAIFRLDGKNEYIKSFKIVDFDNIDGVEETDGLDIVTDSLSEQFPNGLLVVQDGFNYESHEIKPQNFKYIDLALILGLLEE